MTVADFRAGLKPLDPTEAQRRGFRQVFDAIPWTDVREALHAKVELPVVPVYSAFVDRAAPYWKSRVLRLKVLGEEDEGGGGCGREADEVA